MKKIALAFCFGLMSCFAYSQFHYVPVNYGGTGNGLSGFKYKNLYYDARPSGLKAFLEDTEMTPELKAELYKQADRIKTKDIIETAFLWGGFVGGAYYWFSNYNDANDPKISSGDILTGAGIFAAGMLISKILGVKKKDYYKFINTFNSDREKKIKIGLKIDFKTQMNYGIAINF